MQGSMRFKSVKLLGMVVTGRTMVVTLVEVMLVVMMEVTVEVTLVEVVRMSEDSNSNSGCDAAHSTSICRALTPGISQSTLLDSLARVFPLNAHNKSSLFSKSQASHWNSTETTLALCSTTYLLASDTPHMGRETQTV